MTDDSQASPAPGSSPTPPREPARFIAALRTRRGAGLASVAVLAGAIATGVVFAGVGRPSGNAAAGSQVPSPVAAASGPVSTEGATPVPGDSPAVTPASVAPSGGTPSSPPTPAPTPAPTPRPTPELDANGIPSTALQARLDKLTKKLGIPGASVAILWDDGRRWLGASGYRDLGTQDPVTTGTAFALASVSKTMTAAVVLQLVEEGSLSLDTRVAPLLPAYPMHPRITVRNLLDHTSGIPDYFLNARIDTPLQSDKRATWTPAMTWTYVAPPRKRYLPDRIWLYSNANYLLLGELVEAVTGRTLAEEVRARILDPLALETAWYQAEEEPRVTGTRAYRMVPLADGGWRVAPVAKESDVMPFRSVVTAAGGAGSIAASAVDAARWMQAFAGGAVLGDEMQRALLADILTTRKLNAEIPYGLGIQALPIANRFALGHSGRFLGFRNVVRHLPDDGVTIAVLTNQGVQDPARIAEGLLKLVLLPLPQPSGGSPLP